MKLKLSTLLICLLIFFCNAPVHADLKMDSYKNGEKVRKILEQVLAQAKQWTVQIMEGDKHIVCGTIMDADGLILTKASELNGTEFNCVLHDGTSHKAEILTEDAQYDLALLGIHQQSLPVIEWSTKSAEVGQFVSTITGDNIPSTVGVISTPSRKIPRQSGSLGVSFIEEDGSLIFSRVFSNSAAAKFGLLKGDKLIGIGQDKVSKPDEVKRLINRFQPGDLINLQVIREDKPIDLRIRMGDDSSRLSREFMTNLIMGNVSQRRGGFPNVIQHDSPLMVKHTGSSLVGLDGKAIGINIARADRVESFALPAEDIKIAYKKMREKITWPKKIAPAEPQVKQIDPLMN